MKKIFFIHLYILKLLLKQTCTIYGYFDFKLVWVDNYVRYINSSEGIIYEKYKSNLNFPTFIFENVKQDLEKKICIYFYNGWGPSSFAFEDASINEYSITIVDYENWYSCDNCDFASNKKFITTNVNCYNNPFTLYLSLDSYNKTYKFCLEPRNEISQFYIDDNNINKNYYKGKTAIYFINDDTYNIPIADLFSINGFDDLEINIDTISLEISSIQNGKGQIFNGNEELF